jgi:aspartyl-tRNA(Asn)/glutamyl-tRNA(Gln) amidotransferase subunit C
MPLSKQEVQHIANLARLSLSEKEIELYQKQLSDILDHVDALQLLDTSKIDPISGLRVEDSRLREDVAGKAMTREDLLANAPETRDDQFLVPPVLD